MHQPLLQRGPVSFVDGLVSSLNAGELAYEPSVILVTALSILLLLCIVRNAYIDGRRAVLDIVAVWTLIPVCLAPWVGAYYLPDLARPFITYSVTPDYPWVYPTVVVVAAAILATFPKIVHSARA